MLDVGAFDAGGPDGGEQAARSSGAEKNVAAARATATG